MHLISAFSLFPCRQPVSLHAKPRKFSRLTARWGAALVLVTSAGWCAAQTGPATAAPANAVQTLQSPALSPQQRTEVVRHGIPGSDFPISAAVEVPAGANMVYLSGTVPPRVDSAKPANDREAYGGDTRAQTLGVLRSIESQLKSLGLGMGDIVKMQVFLVADATKGNKMDFDGFMAGYTQHFGTAAQPRLPVRSAFQIAALVNPAWLVEIEVTAVRPAQASIASARPATGSAAPAMPAVPNAPAGR